MFRSVKQRESRIKRRRLAAQPLEIRRVLAASLGWDGPGLGSAELTYYVANSPRSLSQAETNAAIQTALDAWSSAADITFTPTNQPGLRDSIDISFTNIDGVGQTLAQAYFPDDVNPARIAGDIQFDISEAWEVGNAMGNRAFDLVYVAVHEIGHSLGLDHSSLNDSVLAPFVSPGQSFDTLNAKDAAAIQTLYAAAESSIATDSTVSDNNAVIETPQIDTPTADTPPVDTLPGQNDTTDTDPGDTDDNPFPRNRWRRGGRWHRFGGRLDVEIVFQNYITPTDVNSDNVTTAMDALMIINQIAKSLSDSLGEVEVVGLCDTTGDGSITALDALTVINAMGKSNVAASAVVDETDTTSESTVDDSTDVTDSFDDTTLPVDDTTEPGDTGDPIDDGGLVDDTNTTDDDSESDEDDESCHDGLGHHGHGRRGSFLGKDAETLIARFDADEDGSLSESEVPNRLWSRLTEQEVDADGDGLITLAELEDAISAARQEAFDGLDTDGDGLIVEAEVSERRWTKISGADSDADGGVSLDELTTYIAERQAELPLLGERLHRLAERVDAVFGALGAGRLGRFHQGRR